MMMMMMVIVFISANDSDWSLLSESFLPSSPLLVRTGALVAMMRY